MSITTIYAIQNITLSPPMNNFSFELGNLQFNGKVYSPLEYNLNGYQIGQFDILNISNTILEKNHIGASEIQVVIDKLIGVYFKLKEKDSEETMDLLLEIEEFLMLLNYANVEKKGLIIIEKE